MIFSISSFSDIKIRTFVTLVAFFSCQILFAQSAEAPEVTLESPYNTIYSHLYYLQPDSYRPKEAAKVLYGIPDSTQRVDLAIKLKQIKFILI